MRKLSATVKRDETKFYFKFRLIQSAFGLKNVSSFGTMNNK